MVNLKSKRRTRATQRYIDGVHAEAKRWSRRMKRCVVISCTRYGLSPQEIKELTGLSIAFVNDTRRQFVHLCTVAVIEDVMKQLPDDEENA